jgi:YesN/AraC family two-component response regulator
LEPLFANAGRGLQFTLPNEALWHLLHPMLQADELTRFTLLLQVLNQLTTLAAVPIASLLYKPMKGNENQQRINKVLLYVQNEFRQNISLQQAASLLHLSESAFCKFFKRTCGKTFSDYTNEIRIAYACQLLIETDKSIGEIAAASGFESLTYFNRVFLRKKSQRPLAFRKMKR